MLSGGVAVEVMGEKNAHTWTWPPCFSLPLSASLSLFLHLHSSNKGKPSQTCSHPAWPLKQQHELNTHTHTLSNQMTEHLSAARCWKCLNLTSERSLDIYPRLWCQIPALRTPAIHPNPLTVTPVQYMNLLLASAYNPVSNYVSHDKVTWKTI